MYLLLPVGVDERTTETCAPNVHNETETVLLSVTTNCCSCEPAVVWFTVGPVSSSLVLIVIVIVLAMWKTLLGTRTKSVMTPEYVRCCAGWRRLAGFVPGSVYVLDDVCGMVGSRQINLISS